jgi:O-succinylbenzoate synthase
VRIGNGFGCLQPWPELGDLTLDRQIRLLKLGASTSHLDRLRICCRFDALARLAGRNELAGLPAPPNHWLEPGSGEIVKLKCGPNPRSEAERISKAEAAKLRLDFNGVPTVDAFLEFVRALGPETLRRIDFVEDPFEAPQSVWDDVQERLPFDLAADRQPVRARVNVLKPACDNIRESRGRVVFTSYMDHPIGQLFAAREAGAYYVVHPHQSEVCGLASHTLFEPDAFIERMQLDGERRLLPVAGTGLGFDDLLATIAWERIN